MTAIGTNYQFAKNQVNAKERPQADIAGILKMPLISAISNPKKRVSLAFSRHFARFVGNCKLVPCVFKHLRPYLPYMEETLYLKYEFSYPKI